MPNRGVPAGTGDVRAPESASGGGPSDDPNRLPLVQFPLYAAFLLIVFSGPMRILLTWIYNSTGRSLPVVSLFHASINATGGTAILTTFFAGVNGLLPYAALAGMAVAVIAATGGRLGLRRLAAGPARPARPMEHTIESAA